MHGQIWRRRSENRQREILYAKHNRVGGHVRLYTVPQIQDSDAQLFTNKMVPFDATFWPYLPWPVMSNTVPARPATDDFIWGHFKYSRLFTFVDPAQCLIAPSQLRLHLPLSPQTCLEAHGWSYSVLRPLMFSQRWPRGELIEHRHLWMSCNFVTPGYAVVFLQYVFILECVIVGNTTF